MSDIPNNRMLSGKTALITGARTGIGQAIAVALAAAGAEVILHGHQDNMIETLEAVSRFQGDVQTILIDLRDPSSIESSLEPILANQTIDILVNNAGIIRREHVASYRSTDWEDVMNVNVNSAFKLSQLLVRPMLQRKSGKIINVASLLSYQGGINVAAYTASKHAIVGLTKSMANECGPFGVQVNAIAPGYIETNNTLALRADEERFNSILGRIPAGRWGRPEDVAGAAVFLASSYSDYVNGHTLVVDGGWMAR